MLKSAFYRLFAGFADTDDLCADTQLCHSDRNIHFYGANRRVFNRFFAVLTVGTFVAMLGIILYYVLAFASLYNGSNKFDWLLGIFSDFVVIMNFSLEESPYVVGDSSYPPIAIAILYPFALICKNAFSKYSFTELTADELTAKVAMHPQFWVAIILFFLICSALTVLLVARLFGIKGRDKLTLGVIILLSAPFVFAVMRGNTIYFALIFLLAFLILKDQKNPVAREFGYFFLALAGAIKIYPLFFGVFLLKDKKIFASFRVAVYFGLISGFSFLMMKNSFDNVSPFLNHLGGFMSNELRLLGTNNLSMTAHLYRFLNLFIRKLDAESVLFSVINLSVLILMFLISTFAAVATKSNFSRYVICFAIVLLIPSISYFYVLIFAILPFMEYLRTYSQMSLERRVFYFFAFMVLFLTPLIVAQNFTPHSIVVIAMLVVELVSVFKELKAGRKLKKA